MDRKKKTRAKRMRGHDKCALVERPKVGMTKHGSGATLVPLTWCKGKGGEG